MRVLRFLILIMLLFCFVSPCFADDKYVSLDLRNPQDVAFPETAKLYMVSLRQVLQRAWLASAPHKLKREVEFLIDLDGSLIGAKVRAPSEYTPDDDEAMAIVNSSFPQPPIPKGVKRGFHIIATFEDCSLAEATNPKTSAMDKLGGVAAGTGSALVKGTGGLLKTLANIPRVVIPKPTYGYSYWQWTVPPMQTPYALPPAVASTRSYYPSLRPRYNPRLQTNPYNQRQAPPPSIMQPPAVGAMNQTYALLAQADQMMKHKQTRQAIDVLRQAAQLETNPNSAAVHGRLGRLLSEDGRPEEALEEYRIAYQLNPGSAQAELGIATCYQSIGDLNGAINALERFLIDHPNDQQSISARRNLEGLKKADREWEGLDPTASDYLDASISKGVRRWETVKLPIKVYVAEGKGIRGYRPEYREYIADALDDWGRTVIGSGSLWVRHERKESADIVCDWSGDRDTSNSTEGGLTSYSMTRRVGSSIADIQSAKITIWTVELGGKAESNSSKIRSVVLHEIGHALGLNHSPNNRDVMFFSVTNKPNDQLSERDRNTIRQLYLLNASDVPSPNNRSD